MFSPKDQVESMRNLNLFALTTILVFTPKIGAHLTVTPVIWGLTIHIKFASFGHPYRHDI